MTQKEQQIKNVTLAYFSGTGCTKVITDCFVGKLSEINIKTTVINIAKDTQCKAFHKNETDLLIVLSPVYSGRLVSIVEAWTKKLPNGKGIKAVVISVSGGGEISPNTACRVKCKNLLQRKGYSLQYEKMIVMPSNFAMSTQPFNYELLTAYPEKVDEIIGDILKGKKNLLKPEKMDRIVAILGKGEHIGARMFGASLVAAKSCNQCGKCIKNCPRKNIRYKGKYPHFGFRCILCMKCIYSCPCGAISPRILRFVVLKDGFNLKKMAEAKSNQSIDFEGEQFNKKQWKGIIEYLNVDRNNNIE